MQIPTDEKQLAALFLRLGAKDPGGWARSQVKDGINQLHRFLFLRAAWSNVISEDDQRWIDQSVVSSKQSPAEPFSGVGQALNRLLAAGASRDDIVDVVRGMQAELLFGLCYLLDDPSLDDPALADLGWKLVETDTDFAPTKKPIGGLHESVLEMDPSGREMRSRRAP